MIRPAKPENAASATAVVVAAQMFTEEEAAFMPHLFDGAEALASDGSEGLVVDVADETEEIVGVAYWRPVEAAEGVVDLTMIAVHPSMQGTGRGTALMRHAEEQARTAGQRLMLVQTSGTAQYDRTRQFYVSLGYEQEAVVRDYWAPGDDMVLFRREL
jgi:GNAT superfamily N-acetyltransferase